MKIEKSELAKNVNLHFIETDKFKTSSISLVLRLPLCRTTVTRAALVPRVLKRGSENYPTLAELSKRAEELYGATISAGTAKKGDNQLLRFSVQSVSDSFIDEKISKDVIKLLAEFVLRPKIEKGAFDHEYVTQEKENAKNFIEGLINDKKEYALVKGTEIMFEGDPYGVFAHGYTSDLDEIDGENLFAFYRELLETAAVDIFVCGSFDRDEIISSVEMEFGTLIKDRVANASKSRLASVEEDINIKRVTEEMPTSQSKLFMGFNCGVEPVSADYYAVMMFGCIFGGSPFSKLFNNVREKLSLAYYVYAALDRQKSFMHIAAGIEADKFDAAYDEIFVQLDKMKKGDFSEEEIVSAKKYLATAMASKNDSMAAMEDFYLGQSLLGLSESLEQLTEKLNAVTRDDIIKAANSVQLDTVYFLKGVGNSEI